MNHASDCAVHNAPAYDAGPCDCGRVGHGYGWETLQAEYGVAG